MECWGAWEGKKEGGKERMRDEVRGREGEREGGREVMRERGREGGRKVGSESYRYISSLDSTEQRSMSWNNNVKTSACLHGNLSHE